MAMQIHGNYDHLGTDYAERMKEKQPAGKAEKAKEAEKDPEAKNSGKLPEPRDEYISSEKSGQKPTGLYQVGQDENGNRKIFFDDPKADHANGKDEPFREGEDGKEPKVSGNSQGKPAEKCVTNTDKVDREIKKLKEKKQQLEQQIQSASEDGKKIRELEKKLAQIENELSQKDNDTYRRQSASVTE
ncbi:hypothetical protein [Parablautia muri]|uniref:Uncharacterized protein n=1 Tax=Parablautia muri TaxID=2320879 RepID=A0A9X5GT91_9FIRM|nr:hypothetical protein [Parablautia muri]NBJ93550.1 hypothetical protein [Parablautia muri]